MMEENKEMILSIIRKHGFEDNLLEQVDILRYLESKTKAINRGSKARASYGNLYAIYVLVEDYNKQKSSNRENGYLGMRYKDAMARTRELPFGAKLQNHALNHRCNMEYKKICGDQNRQIIIREEDSNLYFINEKEIYNNSRDITLVILNIIEKYVENRIKMMKENINELDELNKGHSKEQFINYIKEKLKKTVDARVFEITSFVILKHYYKDKIVTIRDEYNNERTMNLELFKMGRTNANDGGIDFLLNPLGRVFQVTEDLNFKKYFLDIEKLNKYKITFVIKTDLKSEEVLKKIKNNASCIYHGDILNEYLSCFEEIITINELKNCLNYIIENGDWTEIINDLKIQWELEYNMA